MPIDAMLRWFIVVYLLVFAAVRIGFRYRIGNAELAVQRFWCCDDPLDERLSDALTRRLAAGEPSEYVCIVTGIAALGLAVISALTPLAPSLAYAFDCMLVVTVTWSSSKPRPASGPRSAALRNRTAQTVPVVLYAVAGIAALSLVVFGSRHLSEAFAVVAVIVAVGLGIGCAASLAGSPMYLPGHDLEAEIVIDRRLRFFRADSALITAVAPLFVFASFSNYALSTARFASWLLCAAVTVGVLSWFFIQSNRLHLSNAERMTLLQ